MAYSSIFPIVCHSFRKDKNATNRCYHLVSCKPYQHQPNYTVCPCITYVNMSLLVSAKTCLPFSSFQQDSKEERRGVGNSSWKSFKRPHQVFRSSTAFLSLRYANFSLWHPLSLAIGKMNKELGFSDWKTFICSSAANVLLHCKINKVSNLET